MNQSINDCMLGHYGPRRSEVVLDPESPQDLPGKEERRTGGRDFKDIIVRYQWIPARLD